MPTQVRDQKTGVCPRCSGPKKPRAKQCQACHYATLTRPKGEDSPNWKGENIKVASGNTRARRAFHEMDQCEQDGCSKAARDRHHLDGDATNNAPSNIAYLCRTHHMQMDGRLARMHAANRKPPRPCSNCDHVGKLEGHGRCKKCYAYWYRTGNERPEELWTRG